MAEETLLTQEGYDKIVAEHEYLVAVGRKEVAERLRKRFPTAIFPKMLNTTPQRTNRLKLKKEF